MICRRACWSRMRAFESWRTSWSTGGRRAEIEGQVTVFAAHLQSLSSRPSTLNFLLPPPPAAIVTPCMRRKTRKTVGLIGLGIIGSRVATGLRGAGFQVYVWNRSPKPAPNFLASPAEVAEVCETIQIFVADAYALTRVLEMLGPRLTPEHLIICSATIGPEATLEAAKLVEERGARFLDAPFTGSKLAAERSQ